MAKAHLLDDIIVCAPRFYLATITGTIDCLVMRAVHFVKAMRRTPISPHQLNVVILLFRQIVTSYIKLKRAAECDI